MVRPDALQPAESAEVGILRLRTGEAVAATPDAPLPIGIGADGDTLVVQVAGELDLATAPRLASCLSDLRGRATMVAVDLAAVTFIDLSGLKVLVDAKRDADTHGTQLRIAEPGRACARLLGLTRLTHLLETD